LDGGLRQQVAVINVAKFHEDNASKRNSTGDMDRRPKPMYHMNQAKAECKPDSRVGTVALADSKRMGERSLMQKVDKSP